MKDLKTVLAQRDKIYRDQTLVALNLTLPTLEGIQEFLIEQDDSYGPGVFIWEDVALYDGDIVFMTGWCGYTPGTTFTLDGNTVEITEDNQDYWKRPLRFGIPLNIVEEQSKESVYEFLYKLVGVIDEKEDQVTIDDQFEQSQDTDFNLDDLTEEQRAAYQQYKKTEKLN